jgi:hypothetical protein
MFGIYELFDQVLDEFSRPVTYYRGAETYEFNAAFEGEITAQINGVNYNAAKRLVAYSAPVDAFLSGGTTWRPADGDFFEVASNGVVARYKVVKDFEGVKYANWRFRVPGTRVLFYGALQDGVYSDNRLHRGD